MKEKKCGGAKGKGENKKEEDKDGENRWMRNKRKKKESVELGLVGCVKVWTKIKTKLY